MAVGAGLPVGAPAVIPKVEADRLLVGRLALGGGLGLLLDARHSGTGGDGVAENAADEAPLRRRRLAADQLVDQVDRDILVVVPEPSVALKVQLGVQLVQREEVEFQLVSISYPCPFNFPTLTVRRLYDFSKSALVKIFSLCYLHVGS